MSGLLYNCELTWDRGSIAVDGPAAGEMGFSPLLSLPEALSVALGDTFLPFVCGGLPVRLIQLAGRYQNSKLRPCMAY